LGVRFDLLASSGMAMGLATIAVKAVKPRAKMERTRRFMMMCLCEDFDNDVVMTGDFEGNIW